MAIVREADLKTRWSRTQTAGAYSRIKYGTPLRVHIQYLISIALLLFITVPILFYLVFGTTLSRWLLLFNLVF